jgi:tRNA pseudouridine55 synthase
VQALRRELGAGVPVCHGGALDPFAEGLLLLLCGPATRLMELLHAVPKEYEAEVAWGAETDNGDPLGRVVARGDVAALTPARLDAALESFLGWTEQIPPATSNKRVGGERAYLRAHRGETFELPPSRVYLHAARWVEHDLPARSRLWLSARGGFYVRSLVRDLGRTLGARAHVAALRRTAIGPWRDPAPEATSTVSGPAVLPWAAVRELGDAEASRLRGGEPIPCGALRPPEWRVPDGCPDPAAPARAVHRARLIALVREQGGALVRAVDLERAPPRRAAPRR